MHSKVYILSKSIDILGSDCYFPSEYKIADEIGADYVTVEGNDDFRESVKWLGNHWGITIPVVTNNGRIWGEIKTEHIPKILEKIGEEMETRIEKARNALEVGDLWLAAWEAYNKKGFFFAFEYFGLINEIELLNVLKDKKLNKLYIIKTFDYHF